MQMNRQEGRRKTTFGFELLKDMFKDKVYISKVFSIAFPIAVSILLNMIINFADTVMIGKLGENAIASVGLGNKVFFVFALLVFGICSGAGILVSQYWGNKDTENIKRVLGLSIVIALFSAAFFTVPALFYPEFLMRIFTTSPKTIELGIAYLSIVGISYPFTAISNIYVAALRATERVKIPIIISVFTIIINISLNYILIFGKFGMPALGVAGAAYATVIARIFETSFTLIMVYAIKSPLACGINELFSWNKNLIVQFMSTSSPVIANEFMWGLGMTIYSVAYGRMGDRAVAAITITSNLQDLLIVLLQGLSAATLVILGNELGAGRLKTAKRYGSYSYIMAVLLGLAVAIAVFLIKDRFILIYDIGDELAYDVNRCMIVFALFIVFRAVAMVNIVGILRSGGDTVLCFILDTSGVWLIGIPFAFLGGLVWKLPIYYVYALVHIEEIYKAFLGYIRYKQGKWIRNLAVELTKK